MEWEMDKGKEFNKFGYLEFEGKYLFGMKNCKGKEYDNFGNAIFEGEYSLDIIMGKGKEYDRNGSIRNEGNYINGMTTKSLLKISHFDKNIYVNIIN